MLVFDASNVATAQGDTSSATDTIGWLDCAPQFPLMGGDVFFEVSLSAGTPYTITLSPDASYDAALYLLSSCDPVAGCVQAVDGGGPGDPETLTFTPTTSASYLIGVDGGGPPPPPGYQDLSAGTFTIEVK